MKQEIPGDECVTIQHHQSNRSDRPVTAQQLQESSNHESLGRQLTLHAIAMAPTIQEAESAPHLP